MFARLVQAINPKAVIPHHYDIWETLFAAKPELLADMKLPADKVNAEGCSGCDPPEYQRKLSGCGILYPGAS